MAKELLVGMRDALLREKVDLTMPSFPIQIHELAEPNETQFRPRVGRNLALGLLWGLVFAAPGGALVAYLAHAGMRD